MTKYADFSGRARRSEFWFFHLFQLLFYGIIFFLSLVLAFLGQSFFSIVFVLFCIGSIIPHFALMARRLHDIGKSGWYYFVVFIPLIGTVWLIILLLTEGDRGPNKYGPDPKELDF